MTRDEAIRRAEIAMAWARGTEIQFRPRHDDSAFWVDYAPIQERNNQMPQTFTSAFEWRIKPKPLECWVWVGNDGVCGCLQHGANHPTYFPPRHDKSTGRWVRMREVE